MKPRNKVPLLLATFVVVLGLLFGGVSSAQRATFQSPILVVNTSFLNIRTGPGVQYGVLVTVVGGTELPVLNIASDAVWYQVATDAGAGWVNHTFTLPRGDFTHVPVVDLDNFESANLGQGGGGDVVVTGTSSNAASYTGYSLIAKNIYQQPDYNSIVVNSTVPNDPTTIYPLTATTIGAGNVKWYYINVPNVGTGWSDGVELRLLECGGNQVGVIQYEVPIRFDGISTQSSYLVPGQIEVYMQGFIPPSNILMRVQMVDGTVGLVPSDSVRRRTGITSRCNLIPSGGVVSNPTSNLGQGGGGDTTTVVTNGNHVVVNTGNLNVRSGPSAGYSTIVIVSGGTKLAVLGRASDNVWLYVQGDFGYGWVNSSFTLFRGNYASVPVVRDPSILEVSAANLGQGGGGDVVMPVATGRSNVAARNITGYSLIAKNIYQQPDYNSIVVNSTVPNDPTTIYPLTATTVGANGVKWYYINVPNVGTGWSDGVELRLLECGGNQVGVIQYEVPIRFDGISTQSSYLIPGQIEVYMQGFIPPSNVLMRVQMVDGTAGLVPSDSVRRRTGITSRCDMIQGGTSTTVTNNSNVGQGGGGDTPAATSGNHVVVNTGNLNIRSGPGAAFATIVTVSGGTSLSVVGRTSDGIWYLVDGSFGRGWLNAEFVLFRGNYASVPVISFGS